MELIGLAGRKGVGKNTIAKFISEWATEKGLLAIERGFADKLKWAAARVFWPDVTMNEAIEWADKAKNDEHINISYIHSSYARDGIASKYKITAREYLQRFGTEVGRDIFGANFWVDQLLLRDEASMLRNFGDSNNKLAHIAIITDVRFPNEAKRIKDLGGRVWNIKRPDIEDNKDAHASEKLLPLELIDMTINNLGNDLNSLKNDISIICNKIIESEV